MKPMTILVAFTVVVAMIATDADAAKKKRKKYRSAPVPVTQVERYDNVGLCNGGMMVIADDQIKGCTALINSRISRERRATAYYNRGNAYVGKSDFARAIADYTDALKHKTDYAAAFFNRAVAHRISGNPGPAIADYTSAIALTPHDADAFTGRGQAYARATQHDKAAKDFEQAIKLKPDHLTALTQRGHHFVRTQAWAPAIADYTTALSIQKTNTEALYGRGVAKMYSGDMKTGQLDIAQAQAFDADVTARMTSQGIPPPQIINAPPAPAPVAAAPEKPADVVAPTPTAQSASEAPQPSVETKKAESPGLLDELFAEPQQSGSP
jgi:tetratricopeptide (TPR) repeat protein